MGPMSRMRCTKKRVFKLRHNTERDEQTYIHTYIQTDIQTFPALRSRLREPPSAVIRAPPVQLRWSAPLQKTKHQTDTDTTWCSLDNANRTQKTTQTKKQQEVTPARSAGKRATACTSILWSRPPELYGWSPYNGGGRLSQT